MFAAIVSFLGLIPQLFSLFKSIWDFIQQEEERQAKKKLLNDLRDGVKQASESGDTSALENIFKTGNSL